MPAPFSSACDGATRRRRCRGGDWPQRGVTAVAGESRFSHEPQNHDTPGPGPQPSPLPGPGSRHNRPARCDGARLGPTAESNVVAAIPP